MAENFWIGIPVLVISEPPDEQAINVIRSSDMKGPTTLSRTPWQQKSWAVVGSLGNRRVSQRLPSLQTEFLAGSHAKGRQRTGQKGSFANEHRNQPSGSPASVSSSPRVTPKPRKAPGSVGSSAISEPVRIHDAVVNMEPMEPQWSIILFSPRPDFASTSGESETWRKLGPRGNLGIPPG